MNKIFVYFFKKKKKKKEFQKYFFKKHQLATCIFIHVSNRMPRVQITRGQLHAANWPRVIYTRGQLFLRHIWPRGQRHTLSSGRVSTVTGIVNTRRFLVFFVVREWVFPRDKKSYKFYFEVQKNWSQNLYCLNTPCLHSKKKKLLYFCSKCIWR
jgi:hypothetical protein